MIVKYYADTIIISVETVTGGVDYEPYREDVILRHPLELWHLYDVFEGMAPLGFMPNGSYLPLTARVQTYRQNWMN